MTLTLNFRSDNESPAHPRIVDAVLEANQGPAFAYATDEWSERLDSAYSRFFETPVQVIPLSTGTIANSIALAAVTPPWGMVYCHSSAHIFNDESGAPEFLGNGLRLSPVHGVNGRMCRDELATCIRASEGHGVHSYLPSALSLTQSTESGTVYSKDQIGDLCRVAKNHDMACHMDGARFANALASLECHPADITWKAGIDMLSFGATKNGCMGAEALILFNGIGDRNLIERLRKRSGHLLSKMRYVSAQLLAYLEKDLWMHMASHANQQAARFAQAVEQHQQASLEFPVEANEVFVKFPAAGFQQLEQQGVQFLYWPGRDDLARFVFSHATEPEATEQLCHALKAVNVAT